MWTRFMDMHSGGSCKERPHEYIYIEAPKNEACVIFYNRFGHSPSRVSCTCCGDDYSVEDGETLERVTAYERDCNWPTGGKGYDLESAKTTLAEYIARGDVLVIPASEIDPDERRGEVPTQGYVWQD